jgi:hypothetical protein
MKPGDEMNLNQENVRKSQTLYSKVRVFTESPGEEEIQTNRNRINS